jgi:Spy/CpxP family protein refolding chaperone
MNPQPLFAAVLCLLLAPAIAQESGKIKPGSDADRAVGRFFISRATRAAFENDPSGMLMRILVSEGESLFPGSKAEFGFTDEQKERFQEYMNATKPDNWEEFGKVVDNIIDKIAVNADYDLTEDENTAIDSMAGYMFKAANEAAVAAEFTDEQYQKMDGMMLSMTGGLESPFFNDRHMTALDMTAEQKAQFKKINEETKPERNKMIADFSTTVEKMASSGKFEFKDLLAAMAKFRELQKTLKKRRMEVLTESQIAKAAKLAKAPKFMSVLNLLPTWTPGADSWKPGDPVPPSAAPPPSRGNFPRLGN